MNYKNAPKTVTLSLRTPRQHTGVDVQLHWEGWLVRFMPVQFTPGEKNPPVHQTGWWVGPEVGLELEIEPWNIQPI